MSATRPMRPRASTRHHRESRSNVHDLALGLPIANSGVAAAVSQGR